MQFERGEALDKIGQDVKGVLEAEGDEESLKVVSKTVDTVRKQVWLIPKYSYYLKLPNRQSFIVGK